MIEKTILDYLVSVLPVPVKMEVPAEKSERCVILQKTGGGENNYICESMVTVQSYAKSLYDAALLNDAVKEAMKDLTVLPDVCRCRLNSDYYFPDPDSKQYRYQAVFDITHY